MLMMTWTVTIGQQEKKTSIKWHKLLQQDWHY